MSKEEEEEESAFERKGVRDSRLSGCSCTLLALLTSVAEGSKGSREEDEGDEEATTKEEEGSLSPSTDSGGLPSSGESGGGGPRERGGQLMGGELGAHGSVCKRERGARQAQRLSKG